MGPKTGAFSNQVKNSPHEPCHGSIADCTCFWPDTAQVHPSLSTLLDFQFISVAFLANQRPSMFPPYASQTSADVRGNPLHPPHPAPRHRSITRICLLLTHQRRDTEIRHTDTNLHYGHRRQSSVASEIEVCSINAATHEIRAAAAKQADTCVARVAWCEGCGGWSGSPRASTFIRIGGIGWKYGESLVGYKTTTKTVETLAEWMCFRFILQKQTQCVIDQWQGS